MTEKRDIKSVRLTSDGLCVSGSVCRDGEQIMRYTEHLLSGSKNTRLGLLIDTPHSLIVPSDIFDNSGITDILRRGNLIANRDNERAVVVANERFTVVSIVPRRFFEPLEEQYEDMILLSPFHEVLEKPSEKGLGIVLGYRCAYFALWDNGLKALDSLPFVSERDLLYLLSVLDDQFDIRKMRVWIGGLGATAASRLLGKYFRVKCG